MAVKILRPTPNRTKDELLDEIRRVLEDNKKPLSAGKIGRQMGIYEDATHYQMRKHILDLMTRDHIAIGAKSTGYYLIRTEQELYEYLEILKGRIKGIKNRYELVLNSWYERND